MDAIDTHWPGSESDLSDVPLERIDRGNSDLLDDTPVHQHSAELEEMNYVGARLVSRPQDPDGTEYNLMGDTVVGMRVEGAHVSQFGGIDPQGESHSWPTTTWDSLTNNIRRAIFTTRKFPNVGRTNASFKDLFIENWDNQAANFSDYYLLTFDVRFSGFETLP